MQVCNGMIVILSLLLLCLGTENQEIPTYALVDLHLSPVTQLPKHIVHVLLKYLDIPAGFAFIRQNKLLLVRPSPLDLA